MGNKKRKTNNPTKASPSKATRATSARQAAVAAKVNPQAAASQATDDTDPSSQQAPIERLSPAPDSDDEEEVDGDLGPFGVEFEKVQLALHPVWKSPQAVERFQRLYRTILQPYRHVNDWTFPTPARKWGLEIWNPDIDDQNHTAILHSDMRGPTCYAREGDNAAKCHYRLHTWAFLYK